MTRLYLVRHGRASAGFGEALDPGLDEVGLSQAHEAAQKLAELDLMPIISSPMKRCQETAAPLAAQWNQTPIINEGVSEIPSPSQDMDERSAWLRNFLPGTWSEGEDWVHEWKARVVETLMSIDQDSVIFSHFIAINAVVGHALNDDRVVCFRPDNASVTVLEIDGGNFHVLSLGSEANTDVG